MIRIRGGTEEGGKEDGRRGGRDIRGSGGWRYDPDWGHPDTQLAATASEPEWAD